MIDKIAFIALTDHCQFDILHFGADRRGRMQFDWLKRREFTLLGGAGAASWPLAALVERIVNPAMSSPCGPNAHP